MRAFAQVVVAIATSLTLLAGSAEASSRRAASPPEIVVEVSALRARGLTVEADMVQATIAREIAQNGPRRGRVHVRITGLSLAAFAGGAGMSFRGFGSGGVSSDYLEGDFQVLGPGGEVLAGRPMVVNAPASSGGAWYLPGNEMRRIEVLARNFAGWIRQYGG